MKITKQKLESLILEEIKSLQEGSPFQEKTKSAQKEFQLERRLQDKDWQKIK